MKILLLAKLSDNSLNCIVQPLIRSQNVDHIYILRDTKSSIDSDKITFVPQFNSRYKGKFRHVVKIFKGLNLCKTYKIDLIIGILIYPHGYLALMISFFSRVPLIHVTIAGHREFWVYGKIIEKINLFLFKRVLAITVTGEKTRSYLIGKGINPNKIIVLPNVIDFTKYNESGKTRNYDIVSLSGLDKNKNVSLLLRAIAKMRKTSMIKVIIAGDGPELNNLIEEAKLLGIEKNVFFAGWVGEERKKEIFNSSKIFVLCSKGEGFPLALLESMACGCVPVVTDVGDISDVVINGENGYIFNDFNNENNLVHILEKLLKNPEEITIKSKKAQEIKTILSFDNVSRIWDNILMKNNDQILKH